MLPFDPSQAEAAAKRSGTATRERGQGKKHNVTALEATSQGDDAEVTPTMTVDDDSAFLTTPKHPRDSSEMSPSFIFPSRSYDVQQISNIRDVIPEWEDDEVDEIIVLSEKHRELDSIDESQELPESESGTSIHEFEPLEILSVPSLNPLPTTCTVALFKHAPTTSLYAVKTFTKSSISYDTPTLEHAMKEQMILRLLTQMDIPHILKLRWSFQDNESMRLVTEFCPGGDLLARIHRSGPLNSSLAWLYAAELAEALSSLHSSGICHRSLRPEHVLIGADGHLVLTGFSRASVTAFNSPKSEHKAAVDEKERLTRAVDMWSASEVILGWSHDFAVDCWGFGVLVYFMHTGRNPFLPKHKLAGAHAVHPRVLESTILYGPIHLRGWEDDSELTDLVSKCIERNPRIRLTIEDIKDHPYFAEIDWHRVREKGYPAPEPAQNTFEPSADDSMIESFGVQESETLRGVHIAGFDYAYEANTDVKRVDLVEDEVSGIQEHEISSRPEHDSRSAVQDPSGKISGPPAESTYATPADSVISSKAGSAATASTALYSCTSFGELRDALKARPSEKFPLPRAASPDLQSNAADLSHLDVPQGDFASKHNPEIVEQAPSRPTSTLPQQDSELVTSRPSSGLGARGLGLRKYASLDFELDTVVSLEPDLDHSRSPDANERRRFLSPQASAGESKRRVSFAEAIASTSPTDTLSPDSATLGAPTSPWRNLSKYYSPNPNVNKLRKRRTESTPILSASPALQEKVDLPDGLQQIGLGIGYTHAGAAKNKFRLDGTPRRSLSLGTGVAKCSALLSNIRRGMSGPDATMPEAGRTSEESDAMEAVMREMYGSAWNADAGVGYLGSGGYGQAASSRSHVGKVYSVDGGVDEMGSTLRLVQSADAGNPFQ